LPRFSGKPLGNAQRLLNSRWALLKGYRKAAWKCPKDILKSYMNAARKCPNTPHQPIGDFPVAIGKKVAISIPFS
jgi:hypothetical protein